MVKINGKQYGFIWDFGALMDFSQAVEIDETEELNKLISVAFKTASKISSQKILRLLVFCSANAWAEAKEKEYRLKENEVLRLDFDTITKGLDQLIKSMDAGAIKVTTKKKRNPAGASKQSAK